MGPAPTLGLVTTSPRARVAGWARTSEAMALLTVGSAVQRWVPIRHWASWLGESVPVPQPWRGTAVQRMVRTQPRPVDTQVKAAIESGSRHLPWTPSCLAQAIAAQAMLRRRHSAGVVVIGLRRPDTGGDWAAHAWLMVPSGVLTGGPAARGFTATGVFEVPGAVTGEQIAASGLVG